MNRETVEVTMSFLVAPLSRWTQESFLQAMDREGFGSAVEGVYITTTPPLLAERMARTATFTFSSHYPNPDCTVSDAVAAAVEEALRIARDHNVHLLSCSHHVRKEEVA